MKQKHQISHRTVSLVRSESPLVHCITNYVTARDMANVLLAAGASPIMADHPEEAAEITGLSSALLLNLGTLQENSLTSMLRAGSEAARLGRPILLDPVGAGASRLRTDTALELLRRIPINLIRGNVSELKALLREPSSTRGVDAAPADTAAGADQEPLIGIAVRLSRLTRSVVTMTGQTDIITDGDQVALIRNGCPEMTRITGTGCMLDALIAAHAAVGGDRFEASVTATAAAGLCGEEARDRSMSAESGLGGRFGSGFESGTESSGGSGTGSFSVYFLDAVSRLDEEILQGGAKIELR